MAAFDDSLRQGRSGISTIAEYAVGELHNCEKLHARQPFDKLDAIRKPIEAERSRADAERLLTPPRSLVGDSTTEMVPALTDARKSTARIVLVNTLAEPDMLSVDASEHRASLAIRAGVLSAAIDAAKTAKASNSLEKTLCHQAVVGHAAGMELLIKAQDVYSSMPPVEIARLVNAAARMFDVSQRACEALMKLKAKGTQRVVVSYQQQVNVGTGGQALVASKVASRGRGSKRGRRSKSGR